MYSISLYSYMAKKRKLQGKASGIPYDFRKPTKKRIKERMWNSKEKRIFPPRVYGFGWTVNFKNPRSVIALLIVIAAIVLPIIYFTQLLTQDRIIDNGGGIAICIDCIPGYIGGGCTYINENTGEVIQPEQCSAFNGSFERNNCSPESKKAEFCIEIYQPVCGNDARTYPNSCFACQNKNVAFYYNDECSKVLIKEEVICDALNPCQEGQQCIKFPFGEKAICYEGDPCARCPSGQCNIAESYPLQVFCR